jgi:hypothetical protein
MFSTVPLIERVTLLHLARDIDRNGIAFPVLDQQRLAKISAHELFDDAFSLGLPDAVGSSHPPPAWSPQRSFPLWRWHF